jgi:HEAT repeat protein
LHSLALTFDHLAATENEAATALLLAALDHPDRTVAEGAFQTVLRRKSAAGLEEVVRRWHTLSDRWKQIAAQRPGVLTAALRTAFHSPDEQLIRNAADAGVQLADYELAGLFAQSTSDALPLRRRVASEAVLKLAETLYDELHGGQQARPGRRDPQCIREFIVGSLEVPVTTFKDHRSREILEAFLLLAPRECATLRHLLQDAQEPSHEPLCDQLLRSTRPGVVRLLLSMLDDPHAPLAPLRIVGRRCDVGFFRQLCKKLVEDQSPHLETNLGRIDSLVWVEDDKLPLLDSLGEAEQPGVALLATRTRIQPAAKLLVLEHLLAHGRPLGRQAAARALLDIHGTQADWLVLDLIQNPCPLVQAEAIRRLRGCDVPDAVSMLIHLLDSPHDEVQAAAREALAEFKLPRFLQAFDGLSESSRYATGQLVKRVDANAVAELQVELAAPGRVRRLRALQVVGVLDLAPAVTKNLQELCNDEAPAVRLEAIRLLAQCEGIEVRRTLRQLLADASPAVQQAAELSLQESAARDPLASTVCFQRRTTEALP